MTEADKRLWRALQPLRSVVCFLMTGAHPDDEWNGFLAWLALGRGVRTVYACSTRGEGGQNALGPERGRELGALRSREMERAAAEIGLAVRWIGAGAGNGDDDPVHDFGFSKSAEDTLARWGEDRVVERLVQVIRTERPDALSPTFLDVPGQHGHHRAMTRCTLRAAELAADPRYRPPGADMAAWRVGKLYLPAFGGGGGSYDDEVPPPPETVRVDLGARCAALGASWAAIGEKSRAWHASQGMGRTLPDGPRPWPLHLVSGPPDRDLPLDGIAHALDDLAGLLTDAAARPLRAADQAVARALSAGNDRAEVVEALHAALAALDRVRVPSDADDIARRLALKRRQIGRAAALALGFSTDLAVSPAPLRAGQRARLALESTGGASVAVRVPPGWRVADDARWVDIPPDAAPFDTLRDGWDPLGGHDRIGATRTWTRDGVAGQCEIDPPAPLALAPFAEVSVSPSRVVRTADSTEPVLLDLQGAPPPRSWPARSHGSGLIDIDAPMGRLDLPSAGATLLARTYPHIGSFARLAPAAVSVVRAEIAIDRDARVGVVAGDVDVTLGWLRHLGIAAEAIDDAMLAAGDFQPFTTILVGIFAYGQRAALAGARDALMRWMRAGGSLVTLYHRPGDGWDPDTTPPFRLVIGRPSIRWRVADPAAPVTVLAPDHLVMCHPNQLGPEDWDGWVRERGLYFASAWDAAYTPLVELSDTGEAPLRGGVLAARVGQGRHVHVALALHHQFAALVPGAFRFLSNLVARP